MDEKTIDFLKDKQKTQDLLKDIAHEHEENARPVDVFETLTIKDILEDTENTFDLWDFDIFKILAKEKITVTLVVKGLPFDVKFSKSDDKVAPKTPLEYNVLIGEIESIVGEDWLRFKGEVDDKAICFMIRASQVIALSFQEP